MFVAFEEGLLPTCGKDLVDGLAGKRQPQREKEQITSVPRSRTATSPKSTSASVPGRCDCGTNAAIGSRPISVRI
jgi:hypothetical protein